MEDEKKTKKQLIEEIKELRQCVAELNGFEEEIKQIRANQEKFTKAFLQNSIPVGITTLEEGRFVDVSDAFLRLVGRKRNEVVGYTSIEIGFITEEQRASFFNELNKRGRVENLEMEVGTKDGVLRDGIFNAVMITLSNKKYLLTVMTDITERKRAEEDKEKLEAQNQQIQKAESLCRMAGAIAHHFNNQIGVVIGNLEMAIDDLPQGTGPVNKLTTAMKAAGKAAEIGGLILTYLGQTPGKREPLDLSEICRRSLPVLRAVMPGNVALETELPSPGAVIKANANQTQQILTNLATNAWEALGQSRGSIHLNVKTVSAAEIPALCRFPVDWQPQDEAYACLEVMDVGCGIADKDVDKIFDPFFSSKDIGRGLGLSVVMGIVRAHGGAVTVESEPERGTVFRVFLPLFVEEVFRQPDKTSHFAATEAGGTVLLVEDEEMVRNMAADMLKRLGYGVLEAEDGVEAVDVFRQHQDEICCVLCDLTMPRMNGWETLTALQKLAPDIPVILASGYDKAHVMAGDRPEWPQAFLGKPYKLEKLGDTISHALVSKRK